MATIYTYPDAYLAKFCTDARETRAIADVTLRATSANVTFSADWTQRLVIVQCYILACLENQADAEDLFTAKLKNFYRKPCRQRRQRPAPLGASGSSRSRWSVRDDGDT